MNLQQLFHAARLDDLSDVAKIGLDDFSAPIARMAEARFTLLETQLQFLMVQTATQILEAHFAFNPDAFEVRQELRARLAHAKSDVAVGMDECEERIHAEIASEIEDKGWLFWREPL